ncbi:MAG TPA: SDR family oxidoreductase [Puia sp.]|nr:SDR family oxidoreductase [Puia sp.]
MKKLLITGSNGFIAGSVIAHAKNDWEVHGIARSALPDDYGNVHYHLLDLLDAEGLTNLFNKVKPDVVIHAAAIANIDFCEKNKSIAEDINVGVTNTIAQLCKEADIKMIHCSTDTVFDGIKGYYTEDDLPNPVNFYAETKIRSEEIVLKASSKNVVARLALVMGLLSREKGNSFLFDLIEKLKKNEEVKFAENEIRTPVDVVTLGAALVELAGNHFSGIIHLSGNTRINRFEMAKEIATALEFSPQLIIPTNSNTIPDRAPRPNDASMINAKAKQILKTPMRSLQEGLALVLHKKIKESI